MALSREEARNIGKEVADKVSICNCIEPLLVALACAEAMEHNAVVGKEVTSIGRAVKRLVTKEEYEQLLFDHDWLETPITEPIAELAFHLSMGAIEDKCGVRSEDVDKVISLFDSSLEANKKKQFGAAQQGFIDIKSQLVKISTSLCVEEGSNPGGQHVTIDDPGKTTFKPGEVISKEAFDKENERVRKLGEKQATGTPSGQSEPHSST